MRESALLVTPSSPTLQTEEAAEQSGKEGISKILCNAPNVLCIYTSTFSHFFSFLPQKKKKKVRPAVKWRNPDAVTMLLSVNHQRHHLFFKGKKLALLMNSKYFSYAVEYRGKYTAVYDV